MVSRQNEIYSILGISLGEQSNPASPAARTRQEEIFDILSFPAVSRRSSPNDVGATLAVARPNGSPTGATEPMGYGGGGFFGGGGGRSGRAADKFYMNDEDEFPQLTEAAPPEARESFARYLEEKKRHKERREALAAELEAQQREKR